MKNTTKILITLVLFCTASTFSKAQISWFSTDSDRAFLGVESSKISKEKAALLNLDNPYGVIIDKVIEETAAEEAGLKPFDYIVAIDDQELDWTTELTDLISRHEVDEKAVIHFYRKGKKQSLDLTFGARKSGPTIFRKNTFFSEKKPFLGVSENSDNENDEIGVTVNVVDGSTAEGLGLKDGDVVQSINGNTMVDWSDISRAINMMEIGDQVSIDYKRVGNSYKAEGEIRSKASPIYGRLNDLWSNSGGSTSGFLGIYSEVLSKDKAEKLNIENPYGSYVTGVLENTGAQEAGIQPFDYIYGIDEYRVGENQSLTSILRKYKAGEEVTIYLMRKGKNLKYNATLRSRSDSKEKKKSRCEDPFFGVQPSNRSGGDAGVRVNVVKNSTATKLDLASGDILTAINGFPIIDWADVGPAIDMMEVGNAITVDFIRAGQSKQTKGAIGSYCDTYGKERSWSMSLWGDDDPEEEEEEDLSMEVENLNASDIQAKNRSLDLDLPTDNNLTVQNINISTNKQGTITLQFELPQRGETVIKMYNQNGREVYNYDLGTFSGEFTDEVGLSDRDRASYLLHIQQGLNSIIKQISVQ